MEINDVPQFLKNFRKEQGLTQKELASMLYTSRETIAQIENGNRVPNSTLIRRLESINELKKDSDITNPDVANKRYSIGERLESLRKEKGISLKKLSEDTGIPVTILRDFGRLRNKPIVNSVIKLENYFGVSSAYLAGLTDSKGLNSIIQQEEKIDANDSEITSIESNEIDESNRFNLLEENSIQETNIFEESSNLQKANSKMMDKKQMLFIFIIMLIQLIILIITLLSVIMAMIYFNNSI